MPTVSLNTAGSACAISLVPSGTPIRPPITNGQTSEKSMLFQIERKVDICAITEQINQRHRDLGRQHPEPDAKRHQRGAKSGEARHESAGKRAEQQDCVGRDGHFCVAFFVFERRLHDAAGGYYRAREQNNKFRETPR